MEVSHFSMHKRSVSKTRMLEFSINCTQKKMHKHSTRQCKRNWKCSFLNKYTSPIYFFCQTIAEDDKLVQISNKKLIINISTFHYHSHTPFKSQISAISCPFWTAQRHLQDYMLSDLFQKKTRPTCTKLGPANKGLLSNSTYRFPEYYTPNLYVYNVS